MKIIILMVCMLFTSCLTVDKWPESDHQALMLNCRTACGKNRMQSYETLTGECTCRAN